MTRILFVEDDEPLQLLFEHILLGAGYDVDCAASVDAATRLLKGRHYDLVLADGRLADGTGMIVADRAAENGTTALIITGHAFDLGKEELGRYEFLLKPVRPSELLDAIERVLHPARP